MTEVRTIKDGELGAYWEAVVNGFHRQIRDGEVDFWRPIVNVDRLLATFDGEAIVGTAGSFRSQLTVPGGAFVDAGAVTNVTVTATHRRQGLLTAMMREQLDSIAAAGEPLAMLIASEAPIYGRFGYGAATETADYVVDARRAEFVSPPVGSVWRASLGAVAAEVYSRVRQQQVGALEREEWRWGPSPPGSPPLSGEPFEVVYRGGDGRAEGYARYRITQGWRGRVPDATLEVTELCAATDAAYAALWHHCLTVDWVARVKASNRPVVEVLPSLLADPRAVRLTERNDFLWVRLLDIPASLAARTYGADGRLVLEVVDAFRGGASRVALSVSGGVATCLVSTDAPDLTVAVGDLSAAYLGGSVLWPAVAAGRVGVHRPDAMPLFDRMFATDRPPWCNTWF